MATPEKLQPAPRPADLDDKQVGAALVAMVPTFENLATLKTPQCHIEAQRHVRPMATLLEWSHQVVNTTRFEPVFSLAATCLGCENPASCSSFAPMLKIALES